MKRILYYSLMTFAAVSCKEQEAPKRKYVDVAGIDNSINPGDNFFRYVNGTWYDTAKIANDQVGVGSYSFLNIPQKLLLQNILEEASKSTNAAGSIEQKIGDFYASGMDTTGINQRGFEPIKAMLVRIEGIRDRSALMNFVADELKVGDYSIIAFDISPDNDNSSINIAHFGQAGIGLPDRDYYFKNDSSSLAIQSAYKKYIATLFQLTGDDSDKASKNAEITYDIEKQLAASHKTRIETRDVKGNYHNLPVAGINKNHANIAWVDLLKNLGLDTDTVDIQQPAYFDKLNTMLKSISINDWKIYLKASSLTSYDEILSKPFEKASFEYNKALSGQSTEKPRAQIVASAVDRQLGFALGQLYVKKYFNEDAKKRAMELVNNLTKAFENRINQLDWMSDSTKLKAKEKLYAITKKIGYPDVWREYKVKIDRSKYFENVVALRQDNYQYEIGKLNKPPYKHEWGTTPSTVTAYYNPSFNEIVFPAGILQYPYFDLYADDAINYGGIGMVIGHELTHAFDDQGAQFDKNGNVKNWWTKEDYEKFRAKTQQVIDLYGTFTVLDSVHIKGGLTVGENTADNGGIAIAYDAFKMTTQGQDTTRIDGFTPDQRFFLSIARIWRVKTRDAYMRTYVNTNSHSPAMWRVNGPLMNFTPFYNAFNLQPKDKNYKPDSERLKIW
ncbi:MAG: M13 family metallopeptidase [Chryseolinea sp.]